MTHVKMIYDNNIIIGFRMEGHAGYVSKGPDILCASLSAASQMTTNGILDWLGLDADDVLKEWDTKNAIMHVEIPDKLYCGHTVQQLFKSFEMYVEQLIEQYGGYIKLERRQKDDMCD